MCTALALECLLTIEAQLSSVGTTCEISHASEALRAEEATPEAQAIHWSDGEDHVKAEQHIFNSPNP